MRSDPKFPFWMMLYVGTAPILLVATTAWLAGRRAVFWTLASLAMLLMACGPFVGLHHPLFVEGASASPALDTAPPGFVRGPYWLAYHLLDVAFPVARAQVAQVEGILGREGVLVAHAGPLDIHRLTTFRAETVK